MGKIGNGYGSEWHLQQHLRYHRVYLSKKVTEVVGGRDVEWLVPDGFSQKNVPLRDHREFVRLEFIQDTQVQERWKSFWPQTGKAQNWDAVSKIHFGKTSEWLLVEAKGHIGEIKTRCRAKPASRQVINLAFEKTSKAFGNTQQPTENWLSPYYQYANRLAVLYFLMRECSPAVDARLLFIYFYGENRKGCDCPQNEKKWLHAIQKITDWLGVDKHCELAQRVHHLFLPINPIGIGVGKKSNGG